MGRLARLRGRLLRAIGIGLVVSAAVTGLSRLGLFTGWEARAVDAFVFLREQEPAPDIVLATIERVVREGTDLAGEVRAEEES